MGEIIQGVVNPTQNALQVQVVPAGGGSGSGGGSSATKAVPVRGFATVATAGTSVNLAAVGTLVQTVTIYAQKAARGTNTGAVYVDTVGGASGPQIKLNPGAWIVFTAPPGEVIDLSNIYVDALNNGDGVLYVGLL